MDQSYPNLMAFVNGTGAPMYFAGWLTVPNTSFGSWDPRLIFVNTVLAPILIGKKKIKQKKEKNMQKKKGTKSIMIRNEERRRRLRNSF